MSGYAGAWYKELLLLKEANLLQGKGSSGQSGSATPVEFDGCLFSSCSTIHLALPLSKSSCALSVFLFHFLTLCYLTGWFVGIEAMSFCINSSAWRP